MRMRAAVTLGIIVAIVGSTAAPTPSRPTLCRCRKCRPGSSGGMLVFVEDAAESVVSSDVESVDSIGLDDPLGEWAQGCCGAERAVGPVLIVEGFVLAQRMEKMGLVYDQGSVEEFGPA